MWPVFHGSVILPYILKATWYINMILWANESVWLEAWPQNKSWSLWPIFHGSVILAYILKTILCIRRWHWPGVYVSSCSLALVREKEWEKLCPLGLDLVYALHHLSDWTQLFKASVRLTSLLRGQLLKCSNLLPNILIFFVDKNVRTFCNAKASHMFFSKNIGIIQLLTFEILTKL